MLSDFLFCAQKGGDTSLSNGGGASAEAVVTPVSAEQGTACEYVGDVRFPGADKYLGGVRAANGHIYAIPGHAKRVLRVVGDRVDLVGPSFDGKYKWLRGVAGRDGCVYGIPCHATRVLRITPGASDDDEPRVEEFGRELPGDWKWHGAVEDPATGRIYAIPQSAEQVLMITPAEGGAPARVDLVGPKMPGRWKFYGGLYSGGAIYGVPACATGVLRIGLNGTEDADISLIGDGLPAGGWKWHGGAVTPDGCIWGIPSNSATILKIAPKAGVDGSDVVTQEPGPGGADLVGGRHRDDAKYKYLGGVVAADGCLYCIPSDADRVLRVDPVANSASYVGADLGHLAEGQSRGQNKWQNGFRGRDGCVYAIPLKCETVLRVDPRAPPDECVTTVGGPFQGLNLWEGGVEGSDGALYCMPLKCDRVMRIMPPGTDRAAPAAAAAPPADVEPTAKAIEPANAFLPSFLVGCF